MGLCNSVERSKMHKMILHSITSISWHLTRKVHEVGSQKSKTINKRKKVSHTKKPIFSSLVPKSYSLTNKNLIM